MLDLISQNIGPAIGFLFFVFLCVAVVKKMNEPVGKNSKKEESKKENN